MSKIEAVEIASPTRLATEVATGVGADTINSTIADIGSDEVAPSAIITIDEVRKDAEVRTFILQANETLKAIGYTEHGLRHAGLVGRIAQNVLEYLGYDERTYQLANIAGYLHDIGNCIHRENHALSGSLMAWRILTRMGMGPEECALIMNAIGNHEEERGMASTAVLCRADYCR